MIKKFMVLLLVISFSFTMPVRVHADAINVDEYLREKGMSELAIREYSYEEKLELYYADDISFEEASFVQVIDESSQDISSVKPFGAIQARMLKLTLSLTTVKSGSKIIQINVIGTSEWLNGPIVNLQDKIVYSWDNTEIRYKDNSYSRVTYVEDWSTGSKRWVSWSTASYPENLSDGVLASGSGLNALYLNKIVDKFSLVPKVTTPSMNSVQIYMNYYHTIFGSLGFSYGGKYGTFSISGYYDTMALSRTVSW